MAVIKSIDFLPGIFRTTANKKFLNATVDQLIQEPEFKKINGYIGRTFAPTAKAADIYVQEPNKNRQSYQLEPGLVVKNQSGNIEFFSSYLDVLDKIKHQGGFVNNHARLFASEYYSFSGAVDFDKLVNFNQYYWAPVGPAAITVTSGGVSLENTYKVNRANEVNAYKFDLTATELNPTIILSRGGSYKFQVNQLGSKFWVQTEIGTSGRRAESPNLSTREVFGVENNGTENGVITFNAPQLTQQDFYIKMPTVAKVDYATELPFSAIANQLLSSFLASKKGLDGPTADLHNKTLIFANYFSNAADWLASGIFDYSGFDQTGIDYGQDITDSEQQYGTWKITLEPIDSENSDFIIRLTSLAPVNEKEKVFVKQGVSYANTEFFKSTKQILERVPSITAPISTLYYQDANNPRLFGKIVLLDPYNLTLDVETDIVGQKNYTSPNGVKFTNGLKITFDSSVTPSDYVNKTYYVEGVGKSIKLVDVKLLVTPESNLTTYSVPYDSTNYDIGLYDESSSDPLLPDYIVSNRASQDLNPWARQNRWIHEDVIRQTAKYNNTTVLLDQSLRARRPIIEFNANLQLFNFARSGKRPIDILDFTVTNAFADIEGSTTIYNLGLGLETGVRIIFANDNDPLVRNKIYRVNLVNVGGQTRIHLELADDAEINPLDGVVVLQGAQRGTSYWFDGAAWQLAQQKTTSNQAPLFDIVNYTGNSIASQSSNSFNGSKLFSYKQGAGRPDNILGFPIGYRASSFNSIGDIEFVNNYEIETITVSGTTEKISNYFIKENSGTEFNLVNTWSAVNEPSKQYQILSYRFNGTTNYFDIDITAEDTTVTANFKVYVNNQRLAIEQYSITKVNDRPVVEIAPAALKIGDRIDFKIYSKKSSNIGYYEIPANLDYNALNQGFEYLTLGQLRNHLSAIADNNINLVGYQPGSNNLRDLDIRNYPGTILQHSAPTIYSNLFLLDSTANFFEATTLAQKEYTRFKNKFLEAAAKTVGLPLEDPVTGVDIILQNINLVKTSQFPWYYSDMIPYGSLRNTIEYQVYDKNLKDFELTQIFNDAQLSARAVLVYHRPIVHEFSGNVQNKKNVLTQVDTEHFDKIYIGQQVAGVNVANGTYIVGVNNTGYQDTSTITLNNELINTGTITLSTVSKKVQLIKDIDYVFNKTSPVVSLQRSINYGDIITVEEYDSTNGSYVPETPTKLGLYPKFQPSLFLDNTYKQPIYVIQGHDGSITPTFGDYRDQYLLELEKRIYNNIKVNSNKIQNELFSRLPGKFRNNDYSIVEFNKIISRSFLNWVGGNQIDFSSNKNFEANNPFSWNYKRFNDILTNEPLLGHWRGIFKYFYDTDRPHTHPWEMFGFSQQPTWWEQRYGATPATSENVTLWQDVKVGRIAAGNRQGIYSAFARPDIDKIIPVDEFGNLRSPEKFAVKSFNSANASGDWAVGDHAPVETAWRRSSDYPFAIQLALSVCYPAYYFSILLDTSKYQFDNKLKQYQWANTNQKIKPALINLNGEQTKTAGYINWIVDYLTNNGYNPVEKINSYLSQLSVQLVYKAAGYLDKKYLTVLAEQSSPASVNESIILPNENYKVYLAKSPPVNKLVYSAVIVKKTANGYSVQGYDLNNPYFTIIPSLANNQNYAIEVLGQRGIIYENYQTIKLNFPYGHEFTTKQQLIDFLIGYQRFLISQGFVFDQYNTDLKEAQNWAFSAKEFLTWTAQNWATGSVLVLSPVLDTIKLINSSGNVDEIKSSSTGSRVLDLNFQVVNSNSFVCSRIDNQFEITLSNSVTVGLIELNIVEFEHALIFDNETVFNDVIYRSELGNRQFRLKLVGNKTANWDGTLAPAGFIYNDPVVQAWSAGKDYKKNDLIEYKKRYFAANNNVPAADKFDFQAWTEIDKSQIKSGLLPNFAHNASRLSLINDVDNIPADAVVEQYSAGIIGFKPRDYLTDLNVTKTSQAKFYQGYLKEKGTMAAIKALGYSQFADLQSQIDVHEEWAIRVGEYGALDAKKELEIILREDKVKNNPTTLRLFDTTPANLPAVVDVTKNDIYVNATAPFVPFASRTKDSRVENDILTAGYVNGADVDIGIFDITQYQVLDTLLNEIGEGYRIWTARDYNGSWNVYRISNPSIIVSQLTYLPDNIIQIETQTPHGLVADQLFLIKNVGIGFNGFYQVLDIVDNNTVSVFYFGDASALQLTGTLSVQGQLLTVDSVRFAQPSDLARFVPIGGWQAGDKVWIDSYLSQDRWAVLTKQTVWKPRAALPFISSDFIENAEVGASTKFFGTTQKMLAVGQPVSTAGRVHVFENTNAAYSKTQILTLPLEIAQQTTTQSHFGKTISSAGDYLFVSATEWKNQTGLVAVYRLINGSVKLSSVLSAPTLTDGAQFGYAVAPSTNGHKLYVGSPGTNQVFAYAAAETQYKEQELVLTSDLTYAAAEFNSSTIIYNDNNLYVHGIDYSLVNDEIVFNAAPVAGTYKIVSSTSHELIHTFTEASSARYGSAVKTTTDGLQVVITDPDYVAIINGDTYQQAGKFYLYDRVVEAYTGNGTNRQFTTTRAVAANSIVVKVDNQTLTQGPDYQIGSATLINLVKAPASSAVVRIETTEYKKILEKDIANSYARLGTSADICPYNCSLFVSAPQYDTIDYHSGIVQKYTNAGRVYGLVAGKRQDPVVAVGNSLRVNDFEIVFTDTSLESIIEAINQAAIPGVRAAIRDRAIEIKSDSKINADKLRILPGNGTALADLGIEIFELTQTIRHPNNTDGENFGTVVKVDSSKPENLLIASKHAPTYLDTTFDEFTTEFDTGITNFLDRISGTGTVYVLQYMNSSVPSIQSPGQYVHVQQLESISLKFGDGFGQSLDIKDFEIAVGAIGDDTASTNAGQVYLFANLDQTNSWNKTREWEEKVDIDLIDGLYIYDKEDKKIIQRLDFIDPAKGKILGLAGENIDFVTEYDPARYNQGSNLGTSINADYYWAENEVGKIWWDVSTVRFVDYEQGDIAYRTAVWGNMFAGSEVNVYEWVKSTVLPSAYSAANGIEAGLPKYTDNSAYVAVRYIDPNTMSAKTYYYYWVANKAEIGNKETKSLSTQAITKYIQDPTLQSIPFAAFVKNNAIALFNVNQLLVDENRVLHINYSPAHNPNLLHSEYALVKENSVNTKIPARVVSKLVDSLAGKDRNDQLVPDPLLKPGEKFGLMLRPRQTLFANREQAIKNFIQFVNRNLKLFPALTSKNVSKLYEQEQEPATTANTASALYFDQAVNSFEELFYIDKIVLATGYKVLVNVDSQSNNRWAIYTLNSNREFVKTRTQQFKTADYWKAIDWYAVDYDATAKTNFTVELTKDISKLRLATGDTVKVKNNGRGQFEIYQVDETLKLIVVGIQNGTFQILDSLYSATAQPNRELRNIFAALQENVFINEHAIMFNQLFFAMVNYILSEQTFVDWIFKTSFISVFHQLKKLEQFPNFIKDNQTYYESYIKEVKPYRTKIREYQIDYTKLDTAETYSTDFDLPAYWSEQFNTFRSPNGEQPSDVLLLDMPQYRAWRDHHDYEVESISVYNKGSGYTLEPEVIITGGGGFGATARALINADTQQVERIIVTNPGTGYTSQPIITINGNGRQAAACARIVNRKVRSFDTTLKFDRVTYTSQIIDWEAQVDYDKDALVAFNGVAYRVLETLNSGNSFDITKYQIVPAADLASAMDRTMAYYQPVTGMPPKVLDQLFAGLKYPGVKVEGWTFKQDSASNTGFDIDPYGQGGFDAGVYSLVAGELELSPTIDSAVQSYFDDALLGTRAEDINIVGGKFVDKWSSHAPEELIPGMIYDHLSIQVFTKLGTQSTDPVLGYRITKDMVNNRRYHRIAAANTTTLAQELKISDEEILVDNISKLPTPNAARGRPGVVFINGEKIIYYAVDRARSVLKQIRRAASGTGAAVVHAAGSQVVDACEVQELHNANNKIWLNLAAGTIVDGTGFAGSATTQVTFLKEKPSFLP